MTDLQVPSGPGLPEGLLIPDGAVERFSRSSGPGGQHVNTTDTRVELVFDGRTSSVLSEPERERVGLLRVVVADHRSQHPGNRSLARERLAQLVREALAPPPAARVPTKPSKRSRRRRMEVKKRRGQTKALRGRVRD